MTARLPALLSARPNPRGSGGCWFRGRPTSALRRALPGWSLAGTPVGWQARRATRDAWVDLVAEIDPGRRWQLWTVEIVENRALWLLEDTGWGLEELRLTARERGAL